MFEITLQGKKEIAANTWQFIFAKPKNFLFDAGQYTTIFLNNESRDFTICADANNNYVFSIVTKTGVSAFKKNLFTLPKGSKILISKPSGGFTIRKNKVPKVFLAGGIGLTVFYSIVCSNMKTLIPLTLLASFSKKEDVIFRKELEIIQKNNKNITVTYTLSQDVWKGEVGRVSKKLIQKYVPNFQKVEYMIAGGEKMVEDSEAMLLKMGVSQEKIRVDIFTGY